MKNITVSVYEYPELSDAAKEKAREQFREGQYKLQWIADDVTESFREYLKSVSLPYEKVYWSLNYCQGDGMAFYGQIDLKEFLEKTDCEAIKNDARFQKLIDSDSGEPEASFVIVRKNNHYNHWNSMTVECEELYYWNRDRTKEENDAFEKIMFAFRDTIRLHIEEVSRKLEKEGYAEMEYRDSDEVIEENIKANKYLFTEDGNRSSIL